MICAFRCLVLILDSKRKHLETTFVQKVLTAFEHSKLPLSIIALVPHKVCVMSSSSSLNHILLVGSIFPLLRTPLEPLGIIHEIPLPFSQATCPASTLDTFPSIRAAVTTSVGGFPRPLFDLLPALEIISNFGVGVDSIGTAVNEQCERIDQTINTGTCILIDAI